MAGWSRRLKLLIPGVALLVFASGCGGTNGGQVGGNVGSHQGTGPTVNWVDGGSSAEHGGSSVDHGASNAAHDSSPPPAADNVIRNWAGGNLVDKHLANDAYQLVRIESLGANRFRVTGKLRAFEAVGAAVINTSDGSVVPQGERADGLVVIHASEGAPAWGDFHADFEYPDNLKSTVVTVEFYVNSAKDGSKTNVLDIQVELPAS